MPQLSSRLQILLCWNNEGGFLNSLATAHANATPSARRAKLHFLWTNAMCVQALAGAANAPTTRSHSFAPWPRCAGGDSARCRYDDLVIPPWHPSREAMLGLDGIIAVSQWQVPFGPRLRLSGPLVTVRGGGASIRKLVAPTQYACSTHAVRL